MKCIIKTASLISICSFAFSCSVFAEAQSKDYFNQSHVPVALTVPYYDQSDNALTNLDIILQPGDVYQPSDHGNGFLYKKYGLMPDMASNYILVLNDRIPRFHDNSNETVDEEFLRIKDLLGVSQSLYQMCLIILAQILIYLNYLTMILFLLLEK